MEPQGQHSHGAAVFNLSEQMQFNDDQLVNVHLWDGDAFFGRLVCMKRGQVVPLHIHEHKDECFDVIQGEGTFILEGKEFKAGPGMTIYVPAGTVHGLRADGTEVWVLRETVNERVYARRALRLLLRAIWKRVKHRKLRF